MLTLWPSSEPPRYTSTYPSSQVQVPVFWIRQIFSKSNPGFITVPSATVTSATKAELLQLDPEGSGVPRAGEARGFGVLKVNGVAKLIVPATGNVGRDVKLGKAVGLARGVGGIACAVWVCCRLSWAIVVSAAEVYTAPTSGVGAGALPILQDARLRARKNMAIAQPSFLSCMIRPPACTCFKLSEFVDV